MKVLLQSGTLLPILGGKVRRFELAVTIDGLPRSAGGYFILRHRISYEMPSHNILVVDEERGYSFPAIIRLCIPHVPCLEDLNRWIPLGRGQRLAPEQLGLGVYRYDFVSDGPPTPLRGDA